LRSFSPPQCKNVMNIYFPVFGTLLDVIQVIFDSYTGHMTFVL
jgi:hypothetical protein